MKKIMLFMVAVVSMATVIQGCSDTGVSMDPARQKAMVDSLVQVATEELQDSVSAACETRLETEVKVKADSIFRAMKK